MNKLIFNITINFYHETKTAEQMAEELQEYDLLEVMRASIQSNPKAISVAAFKDEEVRDRLADLYNNAELNLWLKEDE